MHLAIHGGSPVVTARLGRPWPIWGDDERRLLGEVLESGRWSRTNYREGGPSKVGCFESAFAQFQDATYGAVHCERHSARRVIDEMSIVHRVASPQLAPWAEVVPDMPLMMVDDLDAIPDVDYVYELVQGLLVRVPMNGLRASNTAYRLGARLSMYIEDHDLGVVTGEQGGYRVDPDHPRTTELAPDLAFVRADRLPPPTSPDYDKAPLLAPDLAVEGASGNQCAPGLAAKAQMYLSFGTRLVWVIWLRYKRVDVWHPGDETPTAIGLEGTLDGEDVVPGFTYAVRRLFA